ncbi:MAG: hypothetical protein SNJ64_07045, partial [Endomicrobiia bacterium]
SAPVPSTATVGTTNYYVSQTTGNCESPRAVITVIVSDPTVPKIQLKAGWNLVGCPIQGSTDIAQALSSIWSQVETVKDNNAFYDTKVTIPVLNTLLKVEWGKGYLVNVKEACELDWIVR